MVGGGGGGGILLIFLLESISACICLVECELALMGVWRCDWTCVTIFSVELGKYWHA